MTDFLKLAAGLSTFNDGRYDGYVIGRAEWSLSGNIRNVESNIKKEKQDYLLAEVIGYDAGHSPSGKLIVAMRKGNLDIFNRKTELPDIHKDSTVLYKEVSMEERKRSLCFCREEVDCYLKAVGDTNSVHYGSQAIVPGLMLLDFILQKEIPSEDAGKGTIRFLNPIPLNDRFVIRRENQQIKIVSLSGEVVFAKIAR